MLVNILQTLSDFIQDTDFAPCMEVVVLEPTSTQRSYLLDNSKAFFLHQYKKRCMVQPVLMKRDFRPCCRSFLVTEGHQKSSDDLSGH